MVKEPSSAYDHHPLRASGGIQAESVCSKNRPGRAGDFQRTLDDGDGSERFTGTLRGNGVSICPLHLVRVELVTGEVAMAEVSGRPGGLVANPWLFPSRRPGKHLDAISLVIGLGNTGVSVLAGRNSALRNLVAEIPPPVVAHLLGYSHNCTQRHAQLAAQPWSRYVT